MSSMKTSKENSNIIKFKAVSNKFIFVYLGENIKLYSIQCNNIES